MKRIFAVSLLVLCLFSIAFQNDNRDKVAALHALINQRIKEAGAGNVALLEQTVREVSPQFPKPTDTLGLLYHRLATLYFNKDLEFKALPNYQKALEIRRQTLPATHFDLSKTLQGYGRTLARVRRLEEALPLLEESMKIRSETLPPQSDSLGESYMILGWAYRENGDYEKAMQLNEKAVSIFANNKRDTSRWSYAFQYLGNSHYRGNAFDKAVENYKKAIVLMEKVQDIKGISECNHNIGCCLADQNRYADALPYFQLAQKYYPHSEYLNNIANAHFHLKNFNKAHQFAQEALDFAAKNQSLCYYYTPRIYITLGDIYASEKKPAEAISAFNKSISLLLNAADTPPLMPSASSRSGVTVSKVWKVASDTISVLPLQAASCRPDLLNVLRKKGRALQQLFAQTNDADALKVALVNYKKCDALLHEMLQSFTEENSRYFWSENVRDIYENGIRTALALNDTDAALAFAEGDKAFNLLSELQNKRAKNVGGVPNELLEKEQLLKSDVAFWQKVAADAAIDSARFAQSREGLLVAKTAFSAFEKELEQKYPRYHQLKYQTPKSLSVDQIRQKLSDKMHVIQYFLSDSTLFVFSISKTDSRVWQKKVDSDFFNQIAHLRRATGDYNFTKEKADSAQLLYLSSAHQLYKTLLADPLSIGGAIERLRIVPDGALSYIPFELLLTDSARTWNATETPWLLKKMAVSYAYSNQLLFAENDGGNAGNFGGYGISYTPESFIFNETEKQNEKLTTLAHTVAEVQNISSLLGGKSWLDKAATKQNFMQNAPKQDMIHLAMHGFLNPNDPLSSGLIFNRENAQDTTNYLTGYDLYAMKLKSQLVVLSACNTGDGILRGHEGIVSLARSFAFAGCQSLVMSLWSVPDKTTSDIMVQFYTELKNGVPRDMALQNAKLKHLSTAEPSRRVPNAWAAVILTGNIDPLPLNRFGFGSVALATLGAGLLFFLFRFFKKNK